MTKDLTAAEAKAAFSAAAKAIGIGYSSYISLDTGRYVNHGGALSCGLYNDARVASGALFRVQADTFLELLAALDVKWAEYSDIHAARTIRDMALEIIRITAELGECTDAALRQKFDAGEVVKYGERACQDATEIASNGPFTIATLGGANQKQAA